MKEMTVKEMYTLEETIAKDLFEGVTYPWEVLPKISSFILELGASLPEEEYEKAAADYKKQKLVDTKAAWDAYHKPEWSYDRSKAWCEEHSANHRF